MNMNPASASADSVKSKLNPGAMTVAEAAKLFSAAAREQISEAMIEADIEGGAPTNPDGTLSLVPYAAWLTKEAASGGT